MSDITDFLNNTIYPLLFERIDTTFPDMSFRRTSRGWESPCKLDGERSKSGRKDKSVITNRRPQRVLENGGDSLTLIDFYGMKNGIDTRSSDGFIEALSSLSRICGVELPQMEGADSYKAQKEKQETLEKVADKMKKSLFSDDPKAKATLSYLTDGRKYDKEFIEFAEFGFVDGSSLEELSSLFSYKDRDGRDIGLPKGVGSTHSLAIPYRTGGRIKGFVFRTIDQECKPKYKDAFISASASKKYNLFGLTGINLTGDGERDRDITIVEGEIDALRASFSGVPNVVAASGGNISKESLQEAKRRGVKRVTLLFDTEGSEDSQRTNYERTKKAIVTIQEEGLTPFVCYLPSVDGSKTDVDSFLQTYSGEQLKATIEEAPTATMFLYGQIVENAIKEQGGEGESTTYRNLDEFKRQVIELANNKYTLPTDRGILFRKFQESTGSYITANDLQEEADLAKEIQNKSIQKEETISLTAEAYSLAKNGCIEEALSLLKEHTGELQRISKEKEFSSLLLNDTISSIKDSFQKRPTGVKTGYSFRTKEGEEEFLLPSGALTYICAPTSHGKSRMLENLALQLATNGEDGATIYFSFEEDESAVKLQLLNMYVDMKLSANNLKSLNSYYKDGTKQYFYDDVKRHHLNEFDRKESEFLSLLTSGKLKVFYKDYDSSELIEAIRYLTRQIKVKAVFIDYIQLLHKRGTRLQRKDELKEMCKDFMTLAVDTKLPIVLAAQLNREALSPIEMEVQHIAEASDIEHSANVVMLLWNSVVKPRAKSGYYTTKGKERVLSDEAQDISDQGFDIGTGGKLYATLAKNRGGERNISAVLDFNGNTGRIKPNHKKVEPKQDILPFDAPTKRKVRF